MTQPERSLLAAAAQLAPVASMGAVVPAIRPLFAGAGTVWLVLAVALPVAVDLASRAGARRLPAAVGGEAARLGAQLAAALILLAVLPAGPTGQSALGGLADGGAQLISSTLPVYAGGPALAVAVGGYLLATVVTLEAGRRSAGALAPLVPAVVVFAGAVLVSAGGPAVPSWDGAVLVVVAGAAGLLRQLSSWWEADRRRPDAVRGPEVLGRARRLAPTPVLLGAAVLAVATLVATPLGDALPGAHRRSPYDLRAALTPPPRPGQSTSLLATFASVYDGPVRPAFDAQVSGTTHPGQLYWRLATYDQFSGDEWTSSAVYRNAGRRLYPEVSPAVPVSAVTATVRLEAPTSFLPTTGVPEEVSVGGLAISVPDNLLAVPAGRPPPSGYTFSAVVPEPTEAELLGARAVTGSYQGGTSPVPTGVAGLAAQLESRARLDAFSRLTTISSYLSSAPFQLHPPGDSPIGDGAYQVQQLLDVTHSGSTEQYASAFALLARAMGYRSRLVVGYAGGRVAPGGAASFTSRDLQVWPEVDLQGIGWMPFPADPAAIGTGHRAPSPAAISQALQRQQQVNQSHAGPARLPAPATPRPVPHHPSSSSLLAGLVVVVVVLGAGPFAGVLVAKSRRRRRQRRAGDPRHRLGESWNFVVDRLVESGVAVPAAMTRAEVVTAVGERLGAACREPVAVLAPLVDRAEFDRRADPGPEGVDRAWAEAERFEQELDRVPDRHRLRARLSPAPWRRR